MQWADVVKVVSRGTPRSAIARAIARATEKRTFKRVQIVILLVCLSAGEGANYY